VGSDLAGSAERGVTSLSVALTVRGAAVGSREREARSAEAVAASQTDPAPRSSVRGVSQSLRLTIVFEPDEEGWIVASVPEVPGALSQGRTRDEARENVIDALHGILELRFGEHALAEPAEDSESLELHIAA